MFVFKVLILQASHSLSDERTEFLSPPPNTKEYQRLTRMVRRQTHGKTLVCDGDLRAGFFEW